MTSNVARALYERGLLALRNGATEEAVLFMERSYEEEPSGETAFTFGLVLQKLGRIDDAASLLREAMARSPGAPDPLCALADIELFRERPEAAIPLYRGALELRDDPGTWMQLGVAYMNARRPTEALEALDAAAIRAPNDLDILAQRAAAAIAAEKPTTAIACLERLLEQRPDSPEFLALLGQAFAMALDRPRAKEAYRQSLAKRPNQGGVWCNLGNLLSLDGERYEAERCLRHAIEVDPTGVEAYISLASLLFDAQRDFEVGSVIDAALATQPKSPDALHGLAVALANLGRFDESTRLHERVVAMAPNHAEACFGLGTRRWGEGKKEESQELFRRAIANAPGHVAAGLALCVAQLPVIARSEEERQACRENYREELSRFSDTVARARPSEITAGISAMGAFSPFFLPYQGECDRDLQSTYGTAICRMLAGGFPKFAEPPRMPDVAPGERIRVGILSAFFSHHSNWKIPIRGWVENLDRRRFELFGYCTAAETDGGTSATRRALDHFVQAGYRVADWCRIIRNDRLHILLIPEIGMDGLTQRLAALKLAPIQVNSWGHPNTSGMPTMDYTLSSELMEPADGDTHYTEKLVRLPNLSFHYVQPAMLPTVVTREELGLRPDDIAYFCCQSLPKYLPRFDDVFARVAKEVPQSRFLFLEHRAGLQFGDILRERLDRVFTRHGLSATKHVRFLSSRPPAVFGATAGCCDVYFDSFGWSGCNSTLESIVHDLPVVTWDGPLMRGRHTGGILRHMGLGDLVCQTPDNAIAMAVRLGLDKGYRDEVRQRVHEGFPRVHKDLECVRGLERFLEEAVTERLA